MLELLVEAWRLSSQHHELAAGASEAELAAAEADLGRSLPEAARALYRLTDGASLLGVNLRVYPLREEELGLVTASEWLRSVEWTIPEELVVFGDNGSDDSFGLWLPRKRQEDDPAPVIQIAEGGEGFAVAGTSLVPFLTGWSANYLLLLEADRSALSVLGVPQRLWDAKLDEELFAELVGWADPDLSDPNPDPYGRPVDVGKLRTRYGSD
jgi:hypothetical protein